MIRPLGLALFAALALVSAPLAASAAPAAKVDMTIDPDHHAQGRKEAPEAAQASGIPCTVTDGYYLGSSQGKDANGKATEIKIYEVACQGGLGQILQYTKGGTASHFDCIVMADSPTVHCRLPANLDLKASITPYVTAAGKTCTVSDERYIASTKTGDVYYEIGCSGALGFILKHTDPSTNSAIDCVSAIGTPLECKFTTAAAIKAADRVVIEKLVADSGKTCPIKDTRSIGKLSAGGSAYEVACTDNTGYMLLAKADGSLQHAYACAQAEGIVGGCKLTDAATAQTQEVATYTRLAKASGFNCEVSKYRFIGVTSTNNEIVELACSNRPDGGLAVLPSDNSAGHVLDCVRAGSIHQECKLTDPSLVYPHLTEALAAKGKGSCKVSNAHWLGAFEQHHSDLIETACSDGLPGWVMEVDASDHALDLMSCGQAKAVGAQCTLPGNTH